VRITFLICLAAVFFVAASADAFAAEELKSARSRVDRLMQLTGDEDFADEQSAWDRTYQRKDFVFGKEPADFLAQNVDKLPKGRALDIAAGEGRNAVFLAKKGFLVEAVDISTVGLRKAQQLAVENRCKIQTVNADLNKYHIKPNNYQVILNFYYLQRNLIPQIKTGLKKGGMVIFESYTIEQLKNKLEGGWEKEYLLQPGELRQAFAQGFEIIHYSETNDGKNAIASLIAKKL
jgi:tellurite methyltransferase